MPYSRTLLVFLLKHSDVAGKLARWHQSGSLAPCSVNNDFARLSNSWDSLQHCASRGTGLDTGYSCSVGIYVCTPHLQMPWSVMCSYVVLCYVCCYSCCASRERKHLEFLHLLFFTSSLLAHSLPTMGSANSVHSEIKVKQLALWTGSAIQGCTSPPQTPWGSGRITLSGSGEWVPFPAIIQMFWNFHHCTSASAVFFY